MRRAAEVSDVERAELAALAEEWRGTEPERGFSMALCRIGREDDPDCVLVTAEPRRRCRVACCSSCRGARTGCRWT